MGNLNKNILSIALAVLIFVSGTTGYMLIEGWTLIESAYMTTITLSTVGYLEVHEVSAPGRIFTIFLIFAGVGYFLYLAGYVVQTVIEGEIATLLGRRKLEKKIKSLENHYIVCGYGRIGSLLCSLIREEIPNIIVIEKDEKLIPELEEDSILYLHGDAADENVLNKAGIQRASVFIAALATDTANVFLVLTVRQLNPSIRIMARASSRAVKQKLLIAGANIVESPYDIGAVSMALRLLRPSVSSFLNVALSRKKDSIQIDESYVSPSSPYLNVSLKESGIRQDYNLIIIAIKKENGEMFFNPSFETLIEAGDIVISMGTPANHKQFHKRLNP